MRRIMTSLLFLVVTMLWVNPAFADYKWNKLDLDTDTTIYISGNYEQDHSIFALADKDMYMSLDEGNTWNKISTLPVWYARTEFDKNLYTLQGNDMKNLSIYKFDPLAQDNWEKVSDAPSGTKLFTVLNNGTIIAAKQHESRSIMQILRTQNRANWQETGFSRAGNLLENTPDNLVFTMENETNRVSKSSNYGMTWKDISSSYKLNKTFVSPLYNTNNEIFAIVNNSNVSISYDRGESWYIRMNGLRANGYMACVAFSPDYMNDHTIYAADTQGQVFISKDNATSWKSLGITLDDDFKLNNFIVLPGNKLIAGTPNGVYELTTYIPPSIRAQTVKAVFVTGKTTYTIGQNDWLMDTTPYIDRDRTYVPVRYLAYSLGMNDSDIIWDDAKKEVILTKNKTSVKMSLGSYTLFINDKPVSMDVLPQMRNGRVFLPARWVAEAFGANVSWDEQKNAVTIEYLK